MLTDAQRTALAERLRRGRELATEQIPRRPAGLGDLPLSRGQEQLWFLDRFAPGLATYNIPLAVALTGAPDQPVLDQPALGRALAALTARHEVLRTRLVARPGGQPSQVIDPPGPVPLPVTRLSGPVARGGKLAAFLHTEASEAFDLAAGPLLRAQLIEISDREHVLLIVVHHAVFDGWSAGVLVPELAALYGQEAAGEPAGLAELPVQFADYALWERQYLDGPVLAELEDYWQQAMAGFETVQLATDHPRPVVDDFSGALAEHLTTPALLDGLRELSRQSGTTLFVTLMAGLQALLARYTGQTDLVVGTVSASRSRAELAPLVGFLVNTLPIRGDLAGDPTFTELLAQLRETTLGAYGHQDLPFAKMVETLGVERDPSRAPVFQIALTYAEREPEPVLAAGVEFTLTDLILGLDAAKFDLAILAEARPEGLWFECSYKTALFDPATVSRLLAHLEVLLAGAVADPQARLSELPVLTEEELYAELVGWNDTAAAVTPACVHELFEARVATAPEAVAARFETDALTYGELNAAANQIARWLRAAGAGPETLIGVYLPAGLPRLAALLGIWKAGGGYVPLDPALPAERLAFLMTDTAMPVVITDAARAGQVPAQGGVRVLDLDAERDQLARLEGGDLTSTEVTPENVAYVIYTSGSTGQPKGVMVEHRQVSNFLPGMAREWDIGPTDVVLQFAAFTFDVSVLDTFMPLLAGAQVVLASAETLHSPPRLAALLRSARITFTSLPPAVLGLLDDGPFPDLRVLMAAGEELPAELARRWIRPGLRLINGYGPTEVTVIATHAELTADTPMPPPIGLPTRPNYQAYVLDRQLNPVPAGMTGELYLGGAGVARGYLNRPELTRERFLPDPFSPEPGGRLYKTGDLVRRRPDGAIVFAGRIDGQVKIRGLRVELGEIEAALARHPAVAQAVVAVLTDAAGDKQLAGYVRPEPGAGAPSAGDLRDHLARSLPAYMVPTFLITVDTFALNASGKVDKRALPSPTAARPAASLEPPRTLLELALLDFYASVLATDQVGATDSFFDLGGNSLQAMRLISMLSDELEVDVSVAAVFLAPTPRRLAALLRDQHGQGDEELGTDGLADLEEVPAAP
jgi:amino acid adenylation domain-containing protein